MSAPGTTWSGRPIEHGLTSASLSAVFPVRAALQHRSAVAREAANRQKLSPEALAKLEALDDAVDGIDR